MLNTTVNSTSSSTCFFTLLTPVAIFSFLIAPPTTAQLVINEVDADTPGTDALEFVELYDGGVGNTSLSGLVVVFYNGANDLSYAAFDLDGFTTNARGFFLMGNSGVVPMPSLVFSNNFLQNGPDAVALYTGNTSDFPNGTPVTTTNLIDAIVYDTSDPDDPGLLVLLNLGQPQVDENSVGNSTSVSSARLPDGGTARSTNTYVQQMPTPGVTNVISHSVEVWQIQGSGLASPLANQIVLTQNNIVTAVAADGFFMQTPASRSDNDPATSDGIFVFTSAAPNVIAGDLIDVSGEVREFFELTEFTNNPTVTIKSSGNPLPPAVQFDANTPSPNQPRSATELERFEGMLVEVTNGTVTGPPDQYGDVSIVAKSVRAFREPGIEFPGLSGLPVWDGNPEIFELDPDRLGLADTTLFAGTNFSAIGVLSFAFEDYQLWPTSVTIKNAPPLPRPVRASANDEVTVSTFNVHGLYDDVDDPGLEEPVPSAAEYQDRLSKFSMYIREVLHAPNILAIQEVENLKTLQDLTSKIKSDDANLNYTAHLIEGNDVGGIDVGFLVRDPLEVKTVMQLGNTETFSFDGSLLHDRPPLLLTAEVPSGKSISVMNLHLRSLSGIDDPIEGPRVRQKRHEQATSVAVMVQNLQTMNSDINLVVTGDLNAFQFTDGYVHVLGQIIGTPADATQALFPGTDKVDPDLNNAILSLPAEEQYSFIFGGNAQVLDHALVSQALQSQISGIAFGRGNADAPTRFEADATTPLRCSDHDGLVLYLRFGTSAVEEKEMPPTVTRYELAPSYPNPFLSAARSFSAYAGTSSTSINFALPETGKVTLRIFTATGQLVRTLIAQEMPAGRHTVPWNGRTESGNPAAAGVYFYRFEVVGNNGETVFAETRRLTLVK